MKISEKSYAGNHPDSYYAYPGFEKNEWRFGHAIQEAGTFWSILLYAVVIKAFFEFPPNPAYGIIVFLFIMCSIATFVSAAANRIGGIYGARPLMMSRNSSLGFGFMIPMLLGMAFFFFAMRSLFSGVI